MTQFHHHAGSPYRVAGKLQFHAAQVLRGQQIYFQRFFGGGPLRVQFTVVHLGHSVSLTHHIESGGHIGFLLHHAGEAPGGVAQILYASCSP